LLQYISNHLNETFMQNDDATVELPGIDMRRYASDKETLKMYNDLIHDVQLHTRKWSRNGWMLAEIESTL